MMLAQQTIHLVVDVPLYPTMHHSSFAKSIYSTTQDFNYMLHYNSTEQVLEFLSQRTKQGYNNKRSRTELNKPWSLEGAVTVPMVTVVYKMADIAMLRLHVINKTNTENIEAREKLDKRYDEARRFVKFLAL